MTVMRGVRKAVVMAPHLITPKTTILPARALIVAISAGAARRTRTRSWCRRSTEELGDELDEETDQQRLELLWVPPTRREQDEKDRGGGPVDEK